MKIEIGRVISKKNVILFIVYENRCDCDNLFVLVYVFEEKLVYLVCGLKLLRYIYVI